MVFSMCPWKKWQFLKSLFKKMIYQNSILFEFSYSASAFSCVTGLTEPLSQFQKIIIESILVGLSLKGDEKAQKSRVIAQMKGITRTERPCDYIRYVIALWHK